MRRSLRCALLTGLLTVACSAAASGAEARPVAVTVQGDSLTVGALPHLPGALGSGYRLVSTSAQVGRRTDDGLALLSSQRLGTVVVVALGTNDFAAPAEWFRARVRRALRIAGPRRCVVMASVYAYRPARAINRVLLAEQRRVGRHRLTLAGWARAVTNRRVRLPDGVHPTAAGYRARARLLAAAVRDCARANRA